MTLDSRTADLARLRSEAETRGGTPYLITVTGDLRPHCSVVRPEWDPATGPIVAAPGKWGESEETGHRAVTLLWPPAEEDGYTLIADGTAAPLGPPSQLQLRITPTRVVLHRPGRAQRPGSPCGADCIQILPS